MVKVLLLELSAAECSFFLLLVATEQRVGFQYSGVCFQFETAKPKITSARKTKSILREAEAVEREEGKV